MSILASVTEIEAQVVDTVRTLQQPVVAYVRKGVVRAEGHLPKLTYPENLPRPTEIVESQVSFAKALLDSQRDFVNELVDAVSPLVRPGTDVAPAEPTATPPKPRAKSTAAKSAKK